MSLALKQRTGIAVGCFVLLVFVVGSVNGFQTSRPAEVWEYKMLSFGPDADDSKIEEKSNEMGRTGWELVTAVGSVFNNVPGNPNRIVTTKFFVFKKLKR